MLSFLFGVLSPIDAREGGSRTEVGGVVKGERVETQLLSLWCGGHGYMVRAHPESLRDRGLGDPTSFETLSQPVRQVLSISIEKQIAYNDIPREGARLPIIL